ncbi:hypothetical protein Dsin_026749 [Dipteronia sinensis]|uniref:Zinc knuckle CX2CX4HX4C domain-containing protein n=1 Tax=Dipteronia sinensis TaxID=43782 RepID=A0AAE0DZJ0_9ROSI|nr:hypothetical protein Dsin_026749 [Dipteronia sinensis]
MIGDFKEIDVGLTGECVGKYILVRVVINVDEPLRRILRVDVMGDSRESIMLLRYEKLPDHCFRRGRIGHVVRDCGEEAVESGPEDFNLLFGLWMKVASPVKKNEFRHQYEDAGNQSSRKGESANRGKLISRKQDDRALNGMRDTVRDGSLGRVTERTELPATPVMKASKESQNTDRVVRKQKDIAEGNQGILLDSTSVNKNIRDNLGTKSLSFKNILDEDSVGFNIAILKTNDDQVGNISVHGGELVNAHVDSPKSLMDLEEKVGRIDGSMREIDRVISTEMGYVLVLHDMDVDKGIGKSTQPGLEDRVDVP